ncbi:MAG TPA: thioredoxin-like domain-containing protein [Chthoniobacteraceae bacterium]|jgi:nucleoredoxin
MKVSYLFGLSALLALGSSACAESKIVTSLTGDLVALEGKKVGRYDTAKLANAKYLAIYYSAAWCGPCRKFTPKLVEWYNQHKAANPHFELIFVSSDQSEPEMEKYIAEDKMPWPALKFAKKDSNKTITGYSGRGIPSLVLIDAEGKVLSDSYVGGKYLGPGKVLQDIEKTLAGDPPSTTASTAPTGASAIKPAPVQGSNFDDFFKKKSP